MLEDDLLIREAAALALSRAGYAVFRVSTGMEALDLVRREALALMVVDLVLPGGLDGLTVARRARAVRPGLRFVFCSGRTLPDERVTARHFGPLIRKPYRETALLQTVAQCLAVAADTRVAMA